MKLKITFLNLFTIVYIIIVLLFTVINYKTLSDNGGWGLLGIIALVFYGIIGFLIDFLLQKFIKNKVILNIVGFIIAGVYFLWIYPQL